MLQVEKRKFQYLEKTTPTRSSLYIQNEALTYLGGDCSGDKSNDTKKKRHID